MEEATYIVDVNEYRELEEKYHEILEKYNNMVKRIESLENIDKPNTRSRSAVSRSKGDAKRKSDNVTTVVNDKKVKQGGDNGATVVLENKEEINKDETMETDTEIEASHGRPGNNFDSSTMIYLKEEAIKLKKFVQNEKMVNEGRNECKRKFHHFSLKLKQSTNVRDHGVVGLFKRISTNIQNLPNLNFRVSAMKEIDCIIGLSNNFIVGDKFDKENEINRQQKICLKDNDNC